MKNIIIIGGGGHAKVIASVLKKSPLWNPLGYIDLSDKGPLLGLPYLGNDEQLTEIIKKNNVLNAAIGIGQIKNVESRKNIISKIHKTGLKFPPIISNEAIINEEVSIGEGTVVMDGVVIQPGVSIGEYSIINTGATVDHDCKIGNYVHVAPGVNISGDVKILENVLIGTGAQITQGIEITHDVIIASGSTISKKIVIPGIYAGIRAKQVR